MSDQPDPLAELASKATSRPWHRVANFDSGLHLQNENGRLIGEMRSECLTFDQDVHNAEFVAAAANYITPATLAAIREREVEIERLTTSLRLTEAIAAQQEAATAKARIERLEAALRNVVEGYDGWLAFCDDPEDGCAEVWQKYIDEARAALAERGPGKESEAGDGK